MNKKKYRQSISGRKTKRNSFLKVASVSAVAIVVFFAPIFSLAADDSKNAGDSVYYLLKVEWNSEDNSLKLASGDSPVSLTDKNILSDTGSGSQFYARVINFNDKAKVFQSGDAKMFLGKWEPKGDAKKVEVKITVPYFSDGQRVIIFDAKEKKVKLVANVMSFAKVKKAATSAAVKSSSAPAQSASPQTYLIGGHSAAYWWTMRILILLILGGGGYFFWRWRKKKKMAQAGSTANFPKN